MRDIHRLIKNNPSTLEISFGRHPSWVTDTPYDICRAIAAAYNIPAEELKKRTDPVILAALGKKWDELLIYTISKEGQTAEGLKEQIKAMTEKVENFISDLISKAEKIAEEQDINNWLWENAVYSTIHKKFIPKL